MVPKEVLCRYGFGGKMLRVPRSREVAEGVRELVEAAVKVYNRYRGAESQAKVAKVLGDTVIVVFEGSFCETCGINDWVDDLRYVIEDLGGEAELVNIIESEDFYSYRIGVFRIRKVPSREELRRRLSELFLDDDRA